MKKPLKLLLWVLILAMSILFILVFSSGGCRLAVQPEEESVVEEPVVEEVTGEPEEEALEESKEEEIAEEEILSDEIVDETGAVTDIDGNVYHTVTIGTQEWMVENLKVTHYSNGDPIPNITDDTQWESLTTGAYCNYGNDPNNSDTHGRLYNWHAVNDNRNICPTGWHVPTDEEWTILEMYLGGSDIAGGKLAEANWSWLSPYTGSTNESGFSALPSGLRHCSGYYEGIGSFVAFWSSTEIDNDYAWERDLYCYKPDIGRIGSIKMFGHSVRCIRD